MNARATRVALLLAACPHPTGTPTATPVRAGPRAILPAACLTLPRRATAADADALVASGCAIDGVSEDGRRTLTHVAVDANAPDALTWLLAHGAPPDFAGPDSSPPLAIAAGASVDLVSALLDAGASARAPLPPDGLTALHYAAQAAHADVVDRLLAAGADPNARAPDPDGRTPLHFAAQASRLPRGAEAAAANTAAALLAAGADPNVATPDGRTALFQAAQTGQLGVLDHLLAAGASTDVVVDGRHSPITIALSRGFPEAAARIAAADPSPTDAEVEAALRGDVAALFVAWAHENPSPPAWAFAAADRCAVGSLRAILPLRPTWTAPDGRSLLDHATAAGCDAAVALLRGTSP